MNIRQNLKEKPLSFRSEIGAFDIFLKRLYVESFTKSLSIENEHFKRVPLCPFKVFLSHFKSSFCSQDNPRPFFKKSNLSISLEQDCKMFYSLFSSYTKLKAIKINWN